MERYWRQQQQTPQFGGMAVQPDRVSIGGLSQMAQQPPVQQPQLNSILQNMYQGVNLSGPGVGSTVMPGNQGRRRPVQDANTLLQQLFAQQPQFDDSVFGQGYFGGENFNFKNEFGGGFGSQGQPAQNSLVYGQANTPRQYLQNSSPVMRMSPLERYAQYKKMGLIG